MADAIGARRHSISMEHGHAHNPTWQAYKILHVGFVLLPLLAGIDKFFNVLVVWERYLWPQAAALVGLEAGAFMRLVGVVEIVAALVVLFAPRIGGLLVAAWLAAIIGNLLLLGSYFDVALRDLGLMLGGLALSRLWIATHRPAPGAVG